MQRPARPLSVPVGPLEGPTGYFFAVFSARRCRAWTYGQTSREALPRGASRCATEGRASRPESLVALGASSLPVAKQAHRKHFPALCVYGRGAPLADIGTWRTATPNLARRTGPPVRHLAKNPNYREARCLAQVVSILGAGVWGVWCRSPFQKHTCAKEAWDLRGGAGKRSPAPTRNSRSMSMCP